MPPAGLPPLKARGAVGSAGTQGSRGGRGVGMQGRGRCATGGTQRGRDRPLTHTGIHIRMRASRPLSHRQAAVFAG